MQPRARETFFPRSRSPSSLRSADAALESSSGDSVASSYGELDLVPEPAAFRRRSIRGRPEMSAKSKSSSPRLIRATAYGRGGDEGPGTSGVAAIAIEPAHQSFEAQEEVSVTTVVPVPYFVPDGSMMDPMRLTPPRRDPIRRGDLNGERAEEVEVPSGAQASNGAAGRPLAPRPPRWLECASARPRSLPQSFGTRRDPELAASSGRRSSTGSWSPARSGSLMRLQSS